MKRVAFVLLLVAGLATMPGTTALAQRPAGDAAIFAAYVGTGYRVAPNVTYTTASGVELKLDFYRPAQASGPLPTAIVAYEQEVREIDALKKAGGVAELVTIPGGGHGHFPRDQVLRAWTAIDTFLQANVVSGKPVTTSAAR